MRIATVTPSSTYPDRGRLLHLRDTPCPLVNRPWIWVTVASDPNPVQQGGFILLKKLGIGCGGLLAVIIVIAVIVMVSSSGGNGGGSPEEAATPPLAVDATTVWDDYQANETRANAQYKEKWLQVTLPTISEIESDGKVRMDVDEFGFNHIELDFRDDSDVIDLSPGRPITAVCQLSGFELDSWLNFHNCRWP